jgi:hypothetical protein
MATFWPKYQEQIAQGYYWGAPRSPIFTSTRQSLLARRHQSVAEENWVAKETRRHPCNRREWATWSRVGPLCSLYNCCWDRIETRVQTFLLLQRHQQAAVAPARECAPWWVGGKRSLPALLGPSRQAQPFWGATSCLGEMQGPRLP